MSARRRHNRDDLLRAAVQVCTESGLQGLSFGAVARRAGVPDRTVVYYFATKADLVEAVLEVMAEALMARLQEAVGDGRRSASALTAAMWPVLTHADVRPVTRVWLEMAVQASGGEGPHRQAAQALAETWLAWLADRLRGTTPAARRAAAASVLARIDGALLLDHMGLAETAETAIS